MNEKLREIPESFSDFITLDTKMTKAEAVSSLGEFYNVSDEAVLNAFMNLKSSKNDVMIEFKESVNNGTPCIAMRGFDKDNKYLWNHLLNKGSGQPQARCG